jgi:glycosyltransferase involved in cell wall biosynthesis
MRLSSSAVDLREKDGKTADRWKELNPLRPMALHPLSKRPRVSILISNYNYGAYLGDAIESALQQTYDKLEVIICDDGSTDDSRRILERYRSLDRRIRVVYQSNAGQSLALNAAFHQSTGHIICLLDADDVFMPGKVWRVVEAFNAAPDAGLVVNRMLIVDKNRKRLGEIPFLHQLPSGWQGPFLSLDAPHFLAAIPPSSGLSLHRSVAEAIFPLPSDLTANSDGVIQVLAPMMTPIVALRPPLSEYRIHGRNTAAISTFTEARVQKLDLWNREIWRVWRRYLRLCFQRDSLDFLLPPETVPTPMSYAYARFRSDPRSNAIYRAVPRGYFETLPRLYRWFWRAARLMPDWLFRRSFNFAYGQTRTKIILGRILVALQNARHDY